MNKYRFLVKDIPKKRRVMRSLWFNPSVTSVKLDHNMGLVSADIMTVVTLYFYIGHLGAFDLDSNPQTGLTIKCFVCLEAKLSS